MKGIVADLAKLEADSALLAALQRRTFIEKGRVPFATPRGTASDTSASICKRSWKSRRRLERFKSLS